MRDEGRLRLRWTGAVPLVWRILAVNIFVLMLLAGGLLYLDSYRARLVEERELQLGQHVQTLAAALRTEDPARADPLIIAYGRVTSGRVRRYGVDGQLMTDSFERAPPTYQLRNPQVQAWQRQVARAMDRAVDWLVDANRPIDYAEPRPDTAMAWPEAIAARLSPGTPVTRYRFAPDRTPMISAALYDPRGQQTLLLLTNARDITRTVRAERQTLTLIFAGIGMLSILLSLFLARTIVRPLQMLARAALQVRQGRARDVVVPRLPTRRDEIGQLARALSDMTRALRDRIDAGEHFAADVTHELKNPLASLRSALEAADRVQQPDVRAQLMAVAADDVRRLDRLITDISEASRIDAEMSRTRFAVIDLGALVETILSARRARPVDGQSPIAFARPRAGSANAAGDPSRLARVIDNLLDNALSFSPAGGVVRIGVTCSGGDVILRFEDDGPGVPAAQREEIFRRFHSIRPVSDDFGKHSGLGLAIARTIVEAHDGTLTSLDRDGGAPGACFEVRLPAVIDAS